MKVKFFAICLLFAFFSFSCDDIASFQVDESIYETCNPECKYNEECQNGECIIPTTCKKDAIACDESGQPVRCDGQMWITLSCHENAKCVEGVCIPNPEVCHNNIKIGVCVDSEQYNTINSDDIFRGTDPYICKDGKWIKGNDCKDYGCNDGICTPSGYSCKGSVYTCLDNIKDIGVIYQCDNSTTWKIYQTCNPGYSCQDPDSNNMTPENLCGECVNGETKCESHKTRICKTGKWRDSGKAC